ncbi:hypothetical protein NB544_03610 [Vibrio parahaemolyticus]|nr:hypothetical protein [Vibrio parahaemolyticus]MCR9760564.1 hypothetical protein [Vibrio parahaemolyticus]MDF4936129.1 hypothetical protein [Vibrio parahaemolyticus]MDG2764482.1 hypothetical protein [Vibrio parahaemolyticus]
MKLVCGNLVCAAFTP